MLFVRSRLVDGPGASTTTRLRPGLGFTLREDVARRHAPHGPQPGTIRSY